LPLPSLSIPSPGTVHSRGARSGWPTCIPLSTTATTTSALPRARSHASAPRRPAPCSSPLDPDELQPARQRPDGAHVGVTPDLRPLGRRREPDDELARDGLRPRGLRPRAPLRERGRDGQKGGAERGNEGGAETHGQ
jgi:hypothetical protein